MTACGDLQQGVLCAEKSENIISGLRRRLVALC